MQVKVDEPLSDVSLKVTNTFFAAYKTASTPDCKKSPKFEESSLLTSPDEIPPTPPVPKRPRLDGKETSAFTKLKPRSIVESAAAKNMHQADTVPKVEELKISEEDCVSAKNKPPRKDFYSLGRHKVLERSLMESGRELRLVVEPQDDTCTMKRVCLLRDFW